MCIICPLNVPLSVLGLRRPLHVRIRTIYSTSISNSWSFSLRLVKMSNEKHSCCGILPLQRRYHFEEYLLTTDVN